MPTELHRIDKDDEPLTRREIATLCGWPDLAGVVVIGLCQKPLPGGMPKVLMYADTSDLGQVAGLLASVARQTQQAAGR